MDIGIPIKGHLKVMLHETVLVQHSVAMLDNFATTGNIVATMFYRCVVLKIVIANRPV